MPVVTNISQQRRRKDRFSVYIDGSYQLSLAQTQLVDAGLRIGDELTDADVAQLAQQSELGKALDRAYNYLALRLRSRQEMLQYFRRKQYDDEMIELLLTRLEHQDLINEERFAKAWVEDRQQLNPRSLTHLRAELRQKGITSEIIEAVLAVPEVTDEVSTIVPLVNGRHLRSRYPDSQKLIRYLAGRGFSFAAITTALEQLEDADN